MGCLSRACVNSYKPFLDLALLVLNPARAVIEEMQRLLEEANGMMHENLRAQLGNIALTEEAASSETAQTADIGQAANFTQRAGRHEQVLFCHKPRESCWTASKALNSWLDFPDELSHCAVLHTGNFSKDQSAAAVYTRLRDDNGSHLWHVTTRLHHAGLFQLLFIFLKRF